MTKICNKNIKKGVKILENLTKNQRIIIFIIIIIISIGMLYFIYSKNQIKETTSIEDEILISNSTEKEENEKKEQVIIHITGSVKNPGIVKLKEGSRIEDAIEAAGGLTENADITNVNLAYVLDDGIKIKIPSVTDEDIEDEVISENIGENIVEENNETSKGNIVNINKATESELQELPGIGSSLASKIIEYRNQNGKFNNIEDIKNVNGIGESKYSSIKDLIKVK
jgi:competence protein ComEA